MKTILIIGEFDLMKINYLPAGLAVVDTGDVPKIKSKKSNWIK